MPNRRTLRVIHLLGSLRIAVPLLLTIAAVLAWGTIYETRFGTAAVQRTVYTAWWFQLLLGFLAVNLAVAAWQRYPWKRHHAPFVLAHLGIILILVGGILGGRFGIEGQLIIPEGQATRTLETPGNILLVQAEGATAQQSIPTRFESRAWMQDPKLTVPVRIGERALELTADRYYPNAVVEEEVRTDGAAEFPAVQVQLARDEHDDTVWLFARDPERFGVGWADLHVLFLEPSTDEQLAQLLGRHSSLPPRGEITLTLAGARTPHEIPVPEVLPKSVLVTGTPYRVMFKEYFSDLAITEQGVINRSNQPNNPAVSLTLTGPEGTDPYLLFALHPEFQSLHGFHHTIPATLGYTHQAGGGLPPNSVAIVRRSAQALSLVLTDDTGAQREVHEAVKLGERYTHSSTHTAVTVVAHEPRAVLEQHLMNRGTAVKAEAVHLVIREGEDRAEAWVRVRDQAVFQLPRGTVTVGYQPATRELPVTVKLLDFRKQDYPGIQLASGFESDVEVTDPQRGIMLMRKISMNKPLRYRGYHFYQSSFIDGPTQTTVLSVRNDPGTPLVYAGFLIVIAGVVSLFVSRRATPVSQRAKKRRRTPALREGIA